MTPGVVHPDVWQGVGRLAARQNLRARVRAYQATCAVPLVLRDWGVRMQLSSLARCKAVIYGLHGI